MMTSKKSLQAKVWYASFILLPVEGESEEEEEEEEEDILDPELDPDEDPDPDPDPVTPLLPLPPIPACPLYALFAPLFVPPAPAPEVELKLRTLADAEASDICNPGPPSLTEFTCVCSL